MNPKCLAAGWSVMIERYNNETNKTNNITIELNTYNDKHVF